MSDYAKIKNVLAETMAEELEWLSHGRVPGEAPDPVYNPWMPFQLADFIAIMSECVVQSEGDVFLEVGSGPGTKVEVARELFGLKAYGLERDKEMFRYAHKAGRATILCDALTANPEHYRVADIIWLYLPFRDQLAQAILEHQIYADMKPGAIIAGAALINPPEGFEIVIDDLDGGDRGAWKKPLNWEPVAYDLED